MIHFIVVYVVLETSKVIRQPIAAYDKIKAWNTIASESNEEISLITIYKNPHVE